MGQGSQRWRRGCHGHRADYFESKNQERSEDEEDWKTVEELEEGENRESWGGAETLGEARYSAVSIRRNR
jgi:hypothetical protein